MSLVIQHKFNVTDNSQFSLFPLCHHFSRRTMCWIPIFLLLHPSGNFLALWSCLILFPFVYLHGPGWGDAPHRYTRETIWEAEISFTCLCLCSQQKLGCPLQSPRPFLASSWTKIILCFTGTLFPPSDLKHAIALMLKM